jgi:hypothetical protein
MGAKAMAAAAAAVANIAGARNEIAISVYPFGGSG